jgi:hypothetical protein
MINFVVINKINSEEKEKWRELAQD